MENINVQSTGESVVSPEKVIVDTAVPSVDAQSTETKEDKNWREFREARKKDRIAREEAEHKANEKEKEISALKAAMEAAFSKSQPPQQENSHKNDQYYEESDDEKIEKKVNAALARRDAEDARRREENERIEYPTKLVRSYPDFNAVISQENLDYLDYHYPEVSRPMQRLSDGFDKWSDIYMAVKKFVPNAANAKKESVRADINIQKPRSASSNEITQPGSGRTSSHLSEERKRENWERIQRAMKEIH